MKRATREWLRWVVTSGGTPEAQDALDSEERLKAEVRRLRAAVEEAIRIGQGAICPHEERHRGGSIWEICDACGAMWADDRGGFRPDPDLAKLEALRARVFNPERSLRPMKRKP